MIRFESMITQYYKILEIELRKNTNKKMNRQLIT